MTKKGECSCAEREHDRLVHYYATHPEELEMTGNFILAPKALYYHSGMQIGEIDLLGLQAHWTGGLAKILIGEVKTRFTPGNLARAETQVDRAEEFLSFKMGLYDPLYLTLLKFGYPNAGVTIRRRDDSQNEH